MRGMDVADRLNQTKKGIEGLLEEAKRLAELAQTDLK
jgi:hypothetical protein